MAPKRRKPPWARALVTGASSGIGDALARRLAAGGCDIVLVARGEDRLRALADQLARDHGVEVEVLAADLTTTEGLSLVEDRLRHAPAIDLLINNAGIGSFGRFFELPLASEDAQVRLNAVAPLRLSHAALGGMMARDRGTILNVSSTVALHPFPGSATYGATKAFVASLSEALHEETRGTGVSVTVVMPGVVHSHFHERMGEADRFVRVPAPAWLSADEVARDALGAAARGRAVCIPSRRYQLGAAMLAALPRSSRRRLAGVIGTRF